MAVMSPDQRRELVNTLALWLANANAGVQCSTDVTPAIIGLIKRKSDDPTPQEDL